MVVDTSVWIDYFAGRDTSQFLRLDSLLDDAEAVALTDIVLTEILQGLRTDDARRVEQRLSAFDLLRLESLEDFRRAAALYRAARRKGVTVRRTNDVTALRIADGSR